MLLLTGTVLVLATWAVGLLVVMSLGLVPASCMVGRRSNGEVLRTALWWGLLIAALLAYSASLLWPLGSGGVAVAVVISTLVLAIPGWWMARRRAGLRGMGSLGRGPWIVVLIAGVAGGAVALALAALGPVTHYDAGLYQLGGIHYARDEPALRGLANLYGPLGYGNAEPLLAALTGSGPWGAEGFRLVNGFVMILVAADMLQRLRERRLSVGFFILVVGVAMTWVPLIGMADFWVTSPTADTAALMLAFIAVAYLADAVTAAGGRGSILAGSTVAPAAILLALVRPTMIPLAVLVFAAASLVVWRKRISTQALAAPGALIVGFTVLAGVLEAMRDRILSGWFLYPLSLLSFDVPWRAPDPAALRAATLGFARDPSNLWGSVSGWGWVGPWWDRAPREWAAWLTVCAVGISSAALLMARRRGVQLRLRALLLVAAPSIVAVILWWTTSPPAFRFAWGSLFTLASLPAAWSLWRMRAAHLAAGIAGVILIAICAIFALVRFDWTSPRDEHALWGVPYAVAPLPTPVVEQRHLPSGLTVLQPRTSDQCWNAYPLCSPAAPESLRPLDRIWQRGLVS